MTDANGAEIGTSDTTGVDPTEIDMTITLKGVDNFAIHPDGAIVTVVGANTLDLGNITMVCGDLTPVLTVTIVDAEAGLYRLALEDAWRYGHMECTLTIGTLEGTDYPADEVTYTFQTACSVSDDFNAETISDDPDSTCWVVGDVPGDRWADMSSYLSIDISNSSLNGDFTGTSEKSGNFYKQIESIGDFEIELFMKEFSSFREDATVNIILTDSGGTLLYNVMFASCCWELRGDYIPACKIEDANGTRYYAECNEDAGYYVKLAKSGNTITRQYKIEDGEYVDLPHDGGTPPSQEITLPDDLNIWLTIASSLAGGETFQLGHVKFTGITVVGQY